MKTVFIFLAFISIIQSSKSQSIPTDTSSKGNPVQNVDSVIAKMRTDLELQMKKIKTLQIQIDDIDDRCEKFSQLNNVGAIMVLGGLAISGYYLTMDKPEESVLWIGGGLAFTGTMIIYFSSNSLRRRGD